MGRGGERWAPEQVCAAAIEAFRRLPTMPVYAPRSGGLAAVLPGQDIGPLEILALSEMALGRDAPERRALLVWARARATGGDVGGSIADYCRANGLSRRTFERRRGRACYRVAAELNRIGDEALAALENLRATAPRSRSASTGSGERLAGRG